VDAQLPLTVGISARSVNPPATPFTCSRSLSETRGFRVLVAFVGHCLGGFLAGGGFVADRFRL
jgi:hypothetical protein